MADPISDDFAEYLEAIHRGANQGREAARQHMQAQITKLHRRVQVAEGAAAVLVSRYGALSAEGCFRMRNVVVARVNCHVDRQYSGCNGLAVLVRDADDEIVHRFPATWTDEQIMHALEFANAAYRSGFMNGGTEKVNEVRGALRILPLDSR